MTPIQLSEPVKIKLRAEVDGKELKGNALNVRSQNADEQMVIAVFV